ncbi:MAG: type I 3-dehydroquinate dehydratase [Bacteroidota bacterium]|nr:MAG: type I 3-dehydroquinate dehydratase [Bacteroidota bacterium]
MICVAISNSDYRQCLATLQGIEMAEIRLDLTGFDEETIDLVFSGKVPLIATCRPDSMSESQQYKLLHRAIVAGAKYVDIELEASDEQRQRIVDLARRHECKVIISYHNYSETPGMRELFEIIDSCFAKGADIAKLATMVHNRVDNARLMSLYSDSRPLVAIGMGEEGKLSRVMAPLLGASFTFAAADGEVGTAPGQISYSDMKAIMAELSKYLTA